MRFVIAVLRQVFRNFRQTWVSQYMTMLTVSLSVFIFAFFFLVYNNMLTIGDKLGYDLRLIVYLEDEPIPELQEQLRRKILAFDEVEDIRFVSKAEAYQRFAEQLGEDRDVLAGPVRHQAAFSGASVAKDSRSCSTYCWRSLLSGNSR